MKRKINFTILVPIFFLVMVLTNSAYAYLDPGSGSMLVQAILVIVATVGVSIGVFKNRLRSYFDRLFSRKKAERLESDDH